MIVKLQETVHGVTSEEVQKALQRNDWNPTRAEQQLKVIKNVPRSFKIISLL